MRTAGNSLTTKESVDRRCLRCHRVFDVTEAGRQTGICGNCREAEGMVTHHWWSEKAQEGHLGAASDPLDHCTVFKRRDSTDPRGAQCSKTPTMWLHPDHSVWPQDCHWYAQCEYHGKQVVGQSQNLWYVTRKKPDNWVCTESWLDPCPVEKALTLTNTIPPKQGAVWTAPMGASQCNTCGIEFLHNFIEMNPICPSCGDTNTTYQGDKKYDEDDPRFPRHAAGEYREFDDLDDDSKKSLMTFYKSESGLTWDAARSPEDIAGGYQYRLEHVPTEELKRRILPTLEDHYDSWDDYAKNYTSGLPKHTERWPVLRFEHPLGYHAEYLEDGYHRLHSYIDAGDETIPVLHARVKTNKQAASLNIAVVMDICANCGKTIGRVGGQHAAWSHGPSFMDFTNEFCDQEGAKKRLLQDDPRGWESMPMAQPKTAASQSRYDVCANCEKIIYAAHSGPIDDGKDEWVHIGLPIDASEFCNPNDIYKREDTDDPRGAAGLRRAIPQGQSKQSAYTPPKCKNCGKLIYETTGTIAGGRFTTWFHDPNENAYCDDNELIRRLDTDDPRGHETLPIAEPDNPDDPYGRVVKGQSKNAQAADSGLRITKFIFRKEPKTKKYRFAASTLIGKSPRLEPGLNVWKDCPGYSDWQYHPSQGSRKVHVDHPVGESFPSKTCRCGWMPWASGYDDAGPKGIHVLARFSGKRIPPRAKDDPRGGTASAERFEAVEPLAIEWPTCDRARCDKLASTKHTRTDGPMAHYRCQEHADAIKKNQVIAPIHSIINDITEHYHIPALRDLNDLNSVVDPASVPKTKVQQALSPDDPRFDSGQRSRIVSNLPGDFDHEFDHDHMVLSPYEQLSHLRTFHHMVDDPRLPDMDEAYEASDEYDEVPTPEMKTLHDIFFRLHPDHREASVTKTAILYVRDQRDKTFHIFNETSKQIECGNPKPEKGQWDIWVDKPPEDSVCEECTKTHWNTLADEMEVFDAFTRKSPEPKTAGVAEVKPCPNAFICPGRQEDDPRGYCPICREPNGDWKDSTEYKKKSYDIYPSLGHDDWDAWLHPEDCDEDHVAGMEVTAHEGWERGYVGLSEDDPRFPNDPSKPEHSIAGKIFKHLGEFHKKDWGQNDIVEMATQWAYAGTGVEKDKALRFIRGKHDSYHSKTAQLDPMYWTNSEGDPRRGTNVECACGHLDIDHGWDPDFCSECDCDRWRPKRTNWRPKRASKMGKTAVNQVKGLESHLSAFDVIGHEIPRAHVQRLIIREGFENWGVTYADRLTYFHKALHGMEGVTHSHANDPRYPEGGDWHLATRKE